MHARFGKGEPLPILQPADGIGALVADKAVVVAGRQVGADSQPSQWWAARCRRLWGPAGSSAPHQA